MTVSILPVGAPATASASIHAQGTFDRATDFMTGWWKSWRFDATISGEGWELLHFEADWRRVVDGVEETFTSTWPDNPTIGPDEFNRRYILTDCDVTYYSSAEGAATSHVTQELLAVRALFEDEYWKSTVRVNVYPQSAADAGCTATVDWSAESTHRGPMRSDTNFELNATNPEGWVFRRWKEGNAIVSKNASATYSTKCDMASHDIVAYFCPVTGLIYCDNGGLILAGTKNAGKILYQG